MVTGMGNLTVADLEAPQKTEGKDAQAFDSGVRSQRLAVGSSGTDIIGGFFSEEYLAKLRGTNGAKIWDEMRRSESQVAMLLSAATNPIKSAQWEIEPYAQEEQYIRHADLVKTCLKEMIDWEQFLHEALTLIPFGYSLFETVHNVVWNHPKFGTFNGLAQLAFRSQKTIERWDLEKGTGKIKSVNQFVISDVGETNVDIPGVYILCFSNLKEGDNYEGISALRPMYGPWIRKNLYLKLCAIGLEKYAVGVVKGTVPAGKEDSTEVTKFKQVLGNFMSHEQGYILTPEGWTVEVVQHEFDAEKVKSIILFENTEMINALVANFLALGTNGAAGSQSLGVDLADFFMGGLQQYGNVIAGGINRKTIPDLVKLNFGPQAGYPKIKCSGINDNAGKELAEVAQILTGSKVIEADLKLEEFMRRIYKLPQKDAGTARQAPAPAPVAAQFSEDRIQLAENYKKDFNEAKTQIRAVMQTELMRIYDGLKKNLRAGWEAAPAGSKVKVALNVEARGLEAYRSTLKELFAEQAMKALDGARKEVPKAKKVKLAESIQLAAPRGGYYAALPPAIRKIVETQAALVAGSQLADLEKASFFQFTSSASSTDSIETIMNDLDEKIKPTLEGGSTKAGMSLDVAAADALAHVAQQARLEFFFDEEVLEEIESFTFENEDPISEICQELDGTTFAPGDPDLSRYSPPLHHNCKSRLVPNLKGSKGNPDVNRGGLSISQKGLDSVTLCEHSPMKLFRE